MVVSFVQREPKFFSFFDFDFRSGLENSLLSFRHFSLSLLFGFGFVDSQKEKNSTRCSLPLPLLPLAACPRASPLRRAVRPTRGRTGQRLRRREAKEKSFLPSLDVPPPLAPPLRLRRAPLLGLKGRPSGALSGRRICRRRGRPNETSEKERARQ